MYTKITATLNIAASIGNTLCAYKYGILVAPTTSSSIIAIFFLLMAGVATVNAIDSIIKLLREDSSNG